MHLKNNFDESDKIRCWGDHPYCALCGSNQGCALHHCDSRTTKSIMSSIMLCYKHHKEADGHNFSDEEYKSMLMKHSLPIILNSGYVLKERDYEYLKTVDKRLKDMCYNISK